MKTIFLIDDDQDSNIILTSYLEDQWRVYAFQEWEAALNEMEKEVPDMIFLDISLPDISGVEVLNRIRENKRFQHVKIVALTGYSLPKDRENFLKQGFDDYLSKPILNESVIINLIKKWLS